MDEHIICQERKSFGSWCKWLFRTYFFRLIGINFVFLVCCIPVVTIPSALCGLHSVIQQYYRKLYAAKAMDAFFSEFRTSFVKRTVIIWSILLIPLGIILWSGKILSNTLWFSLSSILLVAVILVMSWFIPQLVFLDLDMKNALKNAFLLTGIETKTNFLLILVNTASFTVLLFGLPASAFLLMFMPVLITVLTTGITMPVLQKYLARPENTQDKS